MDEHIHRYRAGAQGAWLGIVINFTLMLLKAAAGYFAQSKAMVADAFHSGGDLLASTVVLIGLKISCRPADDDHPYGHWKAESLAQNLVGLLIMLAGISIIISAVNDLRGDLHPPGPLALWVAVLSVVVKEGLFQHNIRLGKRIDSGALIANAWDHRSDALSSLAALVGIIGARLGGYWGRSWLYYLDPLAGVAVALMILRMGFLIMREASGELMESMADQEIRDEICRLAQSVPGVEEVYEIRARQAGPYLLVDLEIGVNGEVTVDEGHRVAHEVEDKLLREKKQIFNVIVHVQPWENKHKVE